MVRTRSPVQVRPVAPYSTQLNLSGLTEFFFCLTFTVINGVANRLITAETARHSLLVIDVLFILVRHIKEGELFQLALCRVLQYIRFAVSKFFDYRLYRGGKFVILRQVFAPDALVLHELNHA